MRQYLTLLFIVCTLSACYLNPKEYAKRYHIDGVVLPEVKKYKVDFCQTKKTECLVNIKDTLESKLPMYEKLKKESNFARDTFLSYYDPLSRYCEFGLFNLDPRRKKDCTVAIKLVCDRVYDKCVKGASNHIPSSEEEASSEEALSDTEAAVPPSSEEEVVESEEGGLGDTLLGMGATVLEFGLYPFVKAAEQVEKIIGDDEGEETEEDESE